MNAENAIIGFVEKFKSLVAVFPISFLATIIVCGLKELLSGSISEREFVTIFIIAFSGAVALYFKRKLFRTYLRECDERAKLGK